MSEEEINDYNNEVRKVKNCSEVMKEQQNAE